MSQYFLSKKGAIKTTPAKLIDFLSYCIDQQVLVLGNTYSLEQRLQLSDDNLASRGPSGGGGTGASTYGERSQSGKGNAIHGLLTHDKGESLLLNLLLPLCLKVGSGRKDAPKMRPQDVKFSLNLLLSLLNPLKGMFKI